MEARIISYIFKYYKSFHLLLLRLHPLFEVNSLAVFYQNLQQSIFVCVS